MANLEAVMIRSMNDLAVYAGRRVLVTGHTGFKGAWLTLWLARLGAHVTGVALAPNPEGSLFEQAKVVDVCSHHLLDIRDHSALALLVDQVRPEIVIHLAAQALVRPSYKDPLGTFETNVLGTAHLLEACRVLKRPVAIVAVTSDKCYENLNSIHGYRETDRLGGHDPYSASKGAAELVAASYRRSFFPPDRLQEHGVALATARAGNVIGGGDWAAERIFVDTVRAFAAREPVALRNPNAVRPWQHVLEPLSGYLMLAAQLVGSRADQVCEAWNFGPHTEDAISVSQLVERTAEAWGSGSWVDASSAKAPHEAPVLHLAIDAAVHRLGWRPRWSVDRAIFETVRWYRAFFKGTSPEGLRALCEQQIEEYVGFKAASECTEFGN